MLQEFDLSESLYGMKINGGLRFTSCKYKQTVVKNSSTHLIFPFEDSKNTSGLVIQDSITCLPPAKSISTGNVNSEQSLFHYKLKARRKNNY